MADDNLGLFDTTHPIILYNPNLLVPKQFEGKGEAKFSARLAIRADHPDLDGMKAAAAAVARAGFPGRAFNTLVFPFKSGDTLADEAKARVEAKEPKARLQEHLRGMVVIQARSKFAPRLALLQNGQIIEFESVEQALPHQGKFFSGAEVLVEIKFNKHQVGTNPPGVNAYLNKVLATGKGTRLAGSSGVADTFRHYIGTISATDPTAGMDDEIPF